MDPRFFRRRSWITLMRAVLQYGFGKRGQRRVHALRLGYRVRIQALLRLRGKVSRIVRRSEVRLLVDGKQAYARLGTLLHRAQHTIIIQMFIWKDDETGRRFVRLLLDAAKRGVRVDITKDATGDIFEFDKDFLGTAELKEGLWAELWSHPNVHIAHVDENNHAKVVVIDDHTLVLGGMNIANEYDGSWHDYMVELRGGKFVQEYLAGEASGMTKEKIQLVVNDQRRKGIRPCVMDLLTRARRSIILEQSYISDPAVVDLLAARSKDGVRITLITSQRPDIHHHANMQAVERLIDRGARGKIHVFLYPGILHGKLILADHRILFIGSTNLMTSSLDEMGEVNVLIEGRHRKALYRIREQVLKDMLKSKPLFGSPHLRWIERFLAALGL